MTPEKANFQIGALQSALDHEIKSHAATALVAALDLEVAHLRAQLSAEKPAPLPAGQLSATPEVTTWCWSCEAQRPHYAADIDDVTVYICAECKTPFSQVRK